MDIGCWIADIGHWKSKYFKMSYKNLKIWKLAKELSIEIHNMFFTLPKFEQIEAAQQNTLSSKSVRNEIVEV